MTCMLIVNYACCGHIETMAGAVAGCARLQGRHVAQIAARLACSGRRAP
jgi:hypothetical protein